MIENATIEASLVGSTPPVAVWNDGGTYKLWTPDLYPGIEPDGLLFDVSDDFQGKIAENGDEIEISEKTATIDIEFQSNELGEQEAGIETDSDAATETIWTVTAATENRYDTGFTDDIGERTTGKILFQDRK